MPLGGYSGAADVFSAWHWLCPSNRVL